MQLIAGPDPDSWCKVPTNGGSIVDGVDAAYQRPLLITVDPGTGPRHLSC